MKKKVLRNDEFLLKFDETKGRGSFKSLESLMESEDGSLGSAFEIEWESNGIEVE